MGGTIIVSGFNAEPAAHFLFEEHRARARYRKIPPKIAPTGVDEAYAVQDIYNGLLVPSQGPIAGRKIATTTKVMQELLGIDRPCSGVIFESRVFTSPKQLDLKNYVNIGIECELAVRLTEDLPGADDPYTKETIADAVGEIMPAIELIEDRFADYGECDAPSLIAENGWNAGVVLGAPVPFTPGLDLERLSATLEVDGAVAHQGRTESPLDALAWIANQAVERGQSLRRGMVVITGSNIATLVSVKAGDRFAFILEGLGKVELFATNSALAA